MGGVLLVRTPVKMRVDVAVWWPAFELLPSSVGRRCGRRVCAGGPRSRILHVGAFCHGLRVCVRLLVLRSPHFRGVLCCLSCVDRA